MPGWKGSAAERRQAATGDTDRSCEHRHPRGTESALFQLGLRRAEHGNPVRVRAVYLVAR
jgi:hypothetical protein